MSETILYDAEGMTAAAEQALKLKNAVDASHEDLLSLRSELKWAISCIAELDVASATSVIISKSKLEAQSEKLDSLADTLDMAADMANSTSSTIQDNLDFFLAILAMASSGSDLTARIAAGLLGTYLTISEIIGKISTGIQATLEPTPEELLEQFSLENPLYASSIMSLREYGYSDQEIFDLVSTNDLKTIKDKVKQETLQRLTTEMDGWYKDMLEKSGRKSYTGACSAFVYGCLCRSGAFATRVDPGCGKGGMYYDTWKKKSVTSTGYSVESVGKTSGSNLTPLEQLIANHEGEALSNVVMSFKPPLYEATYGHVIYINEIRDGTVYFTESQTAQLRKIGQVYEGKVKAVSLDKFVSKYSDMTGVTHFAAPNE